MEEIPTTCSLHADELLKFYCDEHKLWLCELCSKDHKKCPFLKHYSEFEEYAKDESQKKDILKTSALFEGAIELLTDLDKNINTTASQLENKINDLEHLIKVDDQKEKSVEKGSLEEAKKFVERKGITDNITINEIEKIFRAIKEQINHTQIKISDTFCDVCDHSKICAFHDFNMIREWIGKKGTFKQIFNTAKHGFDATEFHKHCNGKAPTLVIAKTSFGKVIGGYTILPWKSTNGEYTADTSKRCFLFSVTLKKKYKMKSSEYAICSTANYGPTFGGGHDFQIVDKCNVNKNQYYNIGHTYDSETADKFYGGTSFFITDYEVYLQQ